jgi:hypothetical protein
MDLDRGQIYFIREKLAGGYSEYTKIGRVAESKTRDSAKRAKEHQTGNPRSLETFNVVTTALHQRVEKTLHREFAQLRIPGGEWFQLSESELSQAIKRCRGLADLHETYVPLFTKVDDYQDTLELGPIQPANEPALKWQSAWTSANSGHKGVARIFTQYRALLKRMHISGIDVTRYAEVTNRPGRTKPFDKVRFSKDHPDLAALYTVVEAGKRGSIDVVPFADYAAIEAQVFEELTAAQSQLELLKMQVTPATGQLDAMHAIFLSLLGLKGIFEGDKLIAEVQLMNLCGNSAGIKDVCRWNVMASNEKINAEALMKDHRELYEKYVSVGKPFTEVKPITGWISLEELG